MAGSASGTFPILEALQSQQTARYRFHVPAHSVFPGEYWGRYDLTELPGLDHLFFPRGCIARAQALASDTFRSGKTYFLVNGSSSGLVAGIFTLCRSGDTLLLGRNSHRSAAAGVIFSGAMPRFIPVGEGPAGIPLNIQPQDVAEAFNSPADQAGAMLLTSPNYWGICSNLSQIAALIRDQNVPLIVDEAHGGHFIFHPGLPEGAACADVDLWVNSGHKTLGALTPGAFLHLSESTSIDSLKLEEALTMVQTASPPYPVLLSLDLTRGWLDSCGQLVFDAALETAARLRREINQSSVFRCLEQDDLPPGLQLDPLRLTVYWEKLSLNGYRVSERLREDYRIEVEMSGTQYIVALIHPGLTGEAAEALISSLRDIEKRFGAGGRTRKRAPYPLPPLLISPREAVKRKFRHVPLNQASGLIAAQLLTPFPPGVPVLYPGEEILPELLQQIETDLLEGVYYQDLVVKQGPVLAVVDE